VIRQENPPGSVAGGVISYGQRLVGDLGGANRVLTLLPIKYVEKGIDLTQIIDPFRY